jgi:DNA-binding NarL/FixJ family response regulator
MRLFIADDSEILMERLVETLSEIEGVEIVGQERDAVSAIEAVKRLKPDLVILDIRMPGGNGIVVLEKLKKMENPPIVAMFTNYPYLQYRKRCFDSGADFFFYKSTEFEKLVEVIRESAKSHK